MPPGTELLLEVVDKDLVTKDDVIGRASWTFAPQQTQTRSQQQQQQPQRSQQQQQKSQQQQQQVQRSAAVADENICLCGQQCCGRLSRSPAVLQRGPTAPSVLQGEQLCIQGASDGRVPLELQLCHPKRADKSVGRVEIEVRWPRRLAPALGDTGAGAAHYCQPA